VADGGEVVTIVEAATFVRAGVTRRNGTSDTVDALRGGRAPDVDPRTSAEPRPAAPRTTHPNREIVAWFRLAEKKLAGRC
jgi:hypothetical protein